MDRDNAERMALLLEEAITNIGQALHATMEAWPVGEYEAFRAHSAEIVSDISVHLLEPIYERFPDLEPELLRSKGQLWRVGERGHPLAGPCQVGKRSHGYATPISNTSSISIAVADRARDFP